MCQLPNNMLSFGSHHNVYSILDQPGTMPTKACMMDMSQLFNAANLPTTTSRTPKQLLKVPAETLTKRVKDRINIGKL